METIRKHSDVIKKLYRENDFPSDRLFHNKPALKGLTGVVNEATGCHFTAEQVAAELERLRKDKQRTGGLPHLGRSYAGPKFIS